MEGMSGFRNVLVHMYADIDRVVELSPSANPACEP